MKQKKLATIALVAAMAIGTLGFSIPAKATEPTTDYVLTIPATLSVANAGWNATDGITAQVKSGDTFDSSKKLTVTAASANEWNLKSGENAIAYKMASATEQEKSYADATATTSLEISAEDLNTGNYEAPFGIVVEDYTDKPAGTYQDTVTFTAKVEDAIKVVDLSTISGSQYNVTENVILTGTPNQDSFTIGYKNDNYEVTLDNVNSAGNKTVFVNGQGYNMNIKLKGTSKLTMLATSKTVTIDEAESGGTVILMGFLSGSPLTINGGTVKARGTDDSPVVGSLTVNGGAVYLAANEDRPYAVLGSITVGSGVTLYGWNGSAWTTDTNGQYVTTDSTSGNPENWDW